MKAIEIKFIQADSIQIIIPLLKTINTNTSDEILHIRLNEMVKQQYKCIGLFHENVLVGIAGLWFLTRHYCGKTIEPDHVVIDEKYRNKGLGRKLFNWIYNYAEQIGYEATELNTYIENVKSHKFYENEGYKKLGYHYLKIF